MRADYLVRRIRSLQSASRALARSLGRRRAIYFAAYCIVLILAYLISSFNAFRDGLLFHARGDFIIFYTAGQMVRGGDAHHLYDLAAQARVQQQIVSPYGFIFEGGVLPYNYPPFFVIPFLPLSLLPLPLAFSVWTLINLILTYAATNSLLRYIRTTSATARIISTLAIFSFFPLFEGLLKGQSTFLAFYLATLAFIALKRGEDYKAGIALALSLIKPTLMVATLAILLYKRRWRALASFCLASGALLLISAGLVRMKGLLEYVDLLIAMGKWNSSIPGIYPASMHNWRGTAYRALMLWANFGSHQADLLALIASMAFFSIAAISLAMSTVCFILVPRAWKAPWNPSSIVFDLRYAVTVIVGLLVNPHLYAYDLTMWILAAFLILHYYRNTKSVKALSLIFLGHVIPFLSFCLGGVIVQAQLNVLFMAMVAIFLWRDIVCAEKQTVWGLNGGSLP